MEQAPDTEANQKRDKRSGEPTPIVGAERFRRARRREKRRSAKMPSAIETPGPSQSILLGGSLD
jgi:hypothetical protein